MAHGQNNNCSHRPTKLRLENTLVLFTAKELDLANILKIVGFGKLVYSCDRRIEWKWSFSTQLGLAKLSLEIKSKMLFFLERQNYFEKKSTSFLVFLLGASYMQKGNEIDFSSPAEKIWFCLILCGNLLLNVAQIYDREFLRSSFHRAPKRYNYNRSYY